MRQFLKRLAHEQNVAVLLSSHQLFEVQNTADRVVIMNKGRVLETKSVEELMHATDDKKTVLIKVENVDETRQILKNCGYEYKQVAADVYEVTVKSGIADFNREIIMKGAIVVSSKEKEIRLEDVFISLTNDNHLSNKYEKENLADGDSREDAVNDRDKSEENKVTEEENEKR